MGLLFFGGGFVFSIIMLFIEPKLLGILCIWVPVIMGYCIFSKFFMDAWKQRNNYIEASEDGLALYSPESKIEFIKWKDVSETKEVYSAARTSRPVTATL
jgi:hypothetical protein